MLTPAGVRSRARPPTTRSEASPDHDDNHTYDSDDHERDIDYESDHVLLNPGPVTGLRPATSPVVCGADGHPVSRGVAVAAAAAAAAAEAEQEEQEEHVERPASSMATERPASSMGTHRVEFDVDGGGGSGAEHPHDARVEEEGPGGGGLRADGGDGDGDGDGNINNNNTNTLGGSGDAGGADADGAGVGSELGEPWGTDDPQLAGRAGGRPPRVAQRTPSPPMMLLASSTSESSHGKTRTGLSPTDTVNPCARTGSRFMTKIASGARRTAARA